MKTINKKKKSDSSKYRTGNLLIDNSDTHHLLVAKKSATSNEAVEKLISVKKKKDKSNQSSKVLISSISLCLSLLFCIAVFEWKVTDKVAEVDLEGTDQSFEDLMEIPQTEQIQKPPVQVQTPSIVEVDDEEIIEEIEINLDIEMTEDTRIEEVIYEEGQGEVLPDENVDEIFTIVEEQPSPVGGMKAFYDFVAAELKYPPRAARLGIEGRVFVEFVVEKDGSLTDIKVVRGISGGCDEEAVRVISEAPPWKPGKQRGMAVRVRMVMPIMFKLFSA